MRRWTNFVVRHRRAILVGWLVAFVVGGFATSKLGDLLTNRFSVPGAEAEKGLELMRERFGAEPQPFTLVFEPTGGEPAGRAFIREAQAAANRAADGVKGGRAGPVQPAGEDLMFAQITTSLEPADASERTDEMRREIGRVDGARTYLTGFPAIDHDTQPIYGEDLARGEMIAIPIALLVLAFMLGTLAGIAIPLLFAAISIPTTLGFVWIFANFMDMAIYVTNIVTLIGIAIAIDYSMLVVYRYREELEQQKDPRAALTTTMSTAGRATFFSGLTVALGLALLVLMPLPFMQSMGIGGLLVPLVSIAASATFLPAVLAVMGRRVNRFRVVPRKLLERRASGEGGMWSRLAHSIMRRPVPYLVAVGGLMLALAYPATNLELTGGDNRGVPLTTEATKGLRLLENAVGAGSLSPNQVVVDTGRPNGAWSERSLASQRDLAASLGGDGEVDPATVQSPSDLVGRPGPPPRAVRARALESGLVDKEGRAYQVRAAGRSDIGTPAAENLVARIRNEYVPEAGFGGARVYVTGAPAFNVDFVDTAYGAFPWLVAAVLVLTYLLLMRAFRSLFLPAKAVFMNLLSVAATYGVLVLAFQEGWGEPFGLGTSPEISAWIPIFLFAMLFGLSMDYEVFLLSRMREEWDKRRNNEEAVAYGLEHTGRIITAAAIIMVAAFSGFTFGSFVELQMFGLGLAAAIILDATLVRAILVPATMKLVGEWNWYLPERVRRAMRLPPLRAPAGSPAGSASGPAPAPDRAGE
jgi:RND superfamily putative drug exporter